MNDAASHALFAADPYIVSYQPESILCSPVIDRDQLIGIIYLENNLAAGAFSPERLQVLKVLTSQVAIADNGAGMSESVKQKIFDPFFTTKPVGKGTGMGMAISYQIITEKHGGKLECFSTLGQGTKFLIQIPIRQSVR